MGLHQEVIDHYQRSGLKFWKLRPEIRAEIRRARPGFKFTFFPNSILNTIWIIGLSALYFIILWNGMGDGETSMEQDAISSLMGNNQNWKVAPETNIETRFDDVLVSQILTKGN